MTVDKKFAKTVAKEMDRRRMRRRMLTLLAILGLVVAAALYLRCGKGWGTGGKGEGKGGTSVGSAVVVDAGPQRCAIRLDAKGISIDGKQMTRDEAIATCKKLNSADVLITGDSRQGDWDDLRAALEAANIPFFAREPRGVTPSDAAP
jgi:hypothetical protein